MLIVNNNHKFPIPDACRKVISIVCEMKKTSLLKKINISKNNEISSILIDKFKFEDVAQIYAENLYILTSGTIPPNPFEILSSKKAKT